jgi:hypothetical protein
MLALRESDPREVGAYRLLGRLGEGGQGVVFLAEGPTGSWAAVKLLSPTTDPQVRSRFLKEVAAAQRRRSGLPGSVPRRFWTRGSLSGGRSLSVNTSAGHP